MISLSPFFSASSKGVIPHLLKHQKLLQLSNSQNIYILCKKQLYIYLRVFYFLLTFVWPLEILLLLFYLCIPKCKVCPCSCSGQTVYFLTLFNIDSPNVEKNQYGIPAVVQVYLTVGIELVMQVTSVIHYMVF